MCVVHTGVGSGDDGVGGGRRGGGDDGVGDGVGGDGGHGGDGVGDDGVSGSCCGGCCGGHGAMVLVVLVVLVVVVVVVVVMAGDYRAPRRNSKELWLWLVRSLWKLLIYWLMYVCVGPFAILLPSSVHVPPSLSSITIDLLISPGFQHVRL
eukprot:TRINITY_DN3334_c0_g2_i4.p1 TRINITY_DN3334_c0_g2~~TRINITY_DN3334_c0_g2_i4.p1  ORF type:complete len:151 (+),score=53.46 TRINITY_DN3334_c0_g2_i4:774-1226(+)